jgi:hypothetical protein
MSNIQTPPPSLRGLWQLFWRSIVFLPVAVVLMTLYFAFWIAAWVLPVAAALHAYLSEWGWSCVLMAIWMPTLFLTRWKRLHLDSRDVLNEHENV